VVISLVAQTRQNNRRMMAQIVASSQPLLNQMAEHIFLIASFMFSAFWGIMTRT
jgi:hypothetical protein